MTTATLALKRVLLHTSTRSSRFHAIRKLKASGLLPISAITCAATPASSSFSTQASLADNNNDDDDDDKNPANYIQGVTTEDVKNDPNLQEYLAANFPNEFGADDESDDIYADLAELGFFDDNNLGMTYEEFVAMNNSSSTTSADGNKNTITASSVNVIGSKNNEDQKEIDISSHPCDAALNIRPLVTFKRDKATEEGSRKCRALREMTDMIPGILYGADPTKNISPKDTSSKMLVKTPWKFLQRELDRFTYRDFPSKVYDLTVYDNDDVNCEGEGTVHRVIPRDVQFHPIWNKVYCCNYLRYYPGRVIPIPILYINEEESAAIKRGGFLVPFNRHVPCIVEDGVKIPDAIELDFTGVKLKEVLRRDRLIFPEGVKPSKKVKEDFLLGTVFGRRSESDFNDADADGADEK